jgi:hypothetical protein
MMNREAVFQLSVTNTGSPFFTLGRVKSSSDASALSSVVESCASDPKSPAPPSSWTVPGPCSPAQFGTEIKSVGVPSVADEVIIAQRSVARRRFLAVYGYKGRIVAAVAFNQNKWLEFYEPLIEQAAPFPPSFHHVDESAPAHPVPAGFQPTASPTQDATAVVTGHDPNERRARLTHPRIPERAVRGDLQPLAPRSKEPSP